MKNLNIIRNKKANIQLVGKIHFSSFKFIGGLSSLKFFNHKLTAKL